MANLSLQRSTNHRKLLGTEISTVKLLIRLNVDVEQATLSLNLALVLDRSTSMERAMKHVKLAAALLVDRMGEDDILAIVTFADRAEVVMPARLIPNPPLVKRHIAEIQARGGTNLFGGLVKGCEEVRRHRSPDRVNRLLLLTDGEPTVGERRSQRLIAVAEEARSEGINISTIGLRDEFDERLLINLAKAGGGNTYYAPSPNDLPPIFRQEMESLRTAGINDVTVQLNLVRGVRATRVMGYPSHQEGRRVHIVLRTLAGGKSVIILAELEFDARPRSGIYRVATVQASCRDPLSGMTEKAPAQDIVLTFVSDGREVDQPDPEVTKRWQAAEAAYDLRQVARKLDNGKIAQDKAVADLHRISKTMVVVGHTDQSEKIQQASEDIGAKGWGKRIGKTLVYTAEDLERGRDSE